MVVCGLGCARRTEGCLGFTCALRGTCGRGAEGSWTDAEALRGACTVAAALRDVWTVVLRGPSAVALYCVF